MLQSIVEKERPCLIHAASGYRGFEMAIMANALSKRYGIPWIYEVRSFHEQTWTDDRQFAVDSERTRLREKRENSLMREADKVVTISESMLRALIERGVDSENISVVPNAMDASMFRPGKKKLKLSRSLNLHKKFVIGYISNMSMREGHDILVNAFNIVSESIEDARLLLVGDGKERDSISRLVSDYGISDKVIMTGEIDHQDVVDYYRLIDLFVVPRRRDYAADLVTPMKPYEAMALKIPIIVSDRDALMEIIGEDRGRSFETEDAEDLARVILDCQINYSDCEKTAESAREWLVENRTWKQNGEIYAKLYEQLTESPIR